MYFLFLLLLLSKQIKNQKVDGCYEICKNCPGPTPVCKACTNGFQLTRTGQCVSSYLVYNCQIFGARGDCFYCKPSFRLTQNNRCQKMYDGCLIWNRNGRCSKCIFGGILNSRGQCDTKYLNCLSINGNKCRSCRQGYYLSANGKCLQNDLNCLQIQPTLGVCLKCKSGYELIGFNCLSTNFSSNCYFSDVFVSGIIECKYCKPGYQLLNNNCQKTINQISNQWEMQYPAANLTIGSCGDKYFFDYVTSSCEMIPERCQKFDFGGRRCQHCKQNYILYNKNCIDQSLRFCQLIATNTQCLKCEPSSYLSPDKLCKELPPFCTKIQNELCTQCRYPFILNSRGCLDPNCQFFEQVSLNCDKCKAYHTKNSTTGICVFNDIYCEKSAPALEIGRNPKCQKCKTNYIFNEEQGLCVYNDPNCESAPKRDYCQLCKNGYYFDTQQKKCTQNPYKCASVTERGYCTSCFPGFTFNQNRKCEQIGKISTCQRSSAQKPNECQKCKQKHYLDPKLKVCIPFPILCIEFDPIKGMCQKCQKNTEKKKGLCFHVYCQYFDVNSQCLGCKPGYQLTSNGECIPQKKEQFCKQSLPSGECKVCADRYYFNMQQKCVDVSALCKKYNPNNGECTECYGGYLLQDGDCIEESNLKEQCEETSQQNKSICIKCSKYYELNTTTNKCTYNEYGCIQIGTNGCIKCKQEYLLDKNNRVCMKVVNISEYITNKSITDDNSSEVTQQVSYVDPNCHLYNSNRTQCLKCNVRNYYNKELNKCVEVDKNCENFDEISGVCNSCFKGFTTTLNKMNCEIEKPKDPFCKFFIQNTPTCVKCYAGYFLSKDTGLCVVDSRNCEKTDSRNEFCQSCWPGYVLKGGSCILQNIQNIVPAPSIKSESQIQNLVIQKPVVKEQKENENKKTVKDCEKFDESLNRCLSCKKYTAYDQSLKYCMSPIFGIDNFCVQYKNRKCSKCQDGYQLINLKCKK